MILSDREIKLALPRSTPRTTGRGGVMTRIRCETRPGISSRNLVAGVGDVYGHRHFMLVDRDFLAVRGGGPYLPVGDACRHRDKGVALIEFAEARDSAQ